MGITKLKTVYWNNQFLSIGDLNSKSFIPLTDIKDVQRTFLFDDFPFKIEYVISGKTKALYFLPKSRCFQDLLSENELIKKLKKEIKKSNTNKELS